MINKLRITIFNITKTKNTTRKRSKTNRIYSAINNENFILMYLWKTNIYLSIINQQLWNKYGSCFVKFIRTFIYFCFRLKIFISIFFHYSFSFIFIEIFILGELKKITKFKIYSQKINILFLWSKWASKSEVLKAIKLNLIPYCTLYERTILFLCFFFIFILFCWMLNFAVRIQMSNMSWKQWWKRSNKNNKKNWKNIYLGHGK